MSLRATLLRDLGRQWQAAGRTGTPTGTLQILIGCANHKFLPVVLVRLAAALHTTPLRPLAMVLSFVNQAVFGVEVALRADIGPGLYFPHTGGIVLGPNRIGRDATIYHGVTVGAQTLDFAYSSTERPTIGDFVVIGSGAKVLGGLTIGDGAVVGANAVVVGDVAPGAAVGGVPAKPLSRSRTDSNE